MFYEPPYLVQTSHPPLHHPNKPNTKPKKKRPKKGTYPYIQSNITPKTPDYHVGVADRYTEVQNLININQP